MEGVTIGKLFDYCLQIDVMFRNDINGLEPELRERLHGLFMARWEYFHATLMTAARVLDPEFICLKHEEAEKEEFRKVLKQMATEEHTFAAIWNDYNQLMQDLKDDGMVGGEERDSAVDGKKSNIFELGAFTLEARKIMPHKWARNYLGDYKHLQYVAMRLTVIATSASACERSWSTEGWMHNERRNRLSQRRVQELMTIRSCEAFLEERRCPTSPVPWDLRLTPDDEAECEEEVPTDPKTPTKRPRLATP